jgi:hypothetical protein
MAGSISIDLHDVIPSQGPIQFVRAELPRQLRPTLALVRYARSGVEQATGGRLDLDKRVFIDHFEGDPEVEAAFRSAALPIASHVGAMLRERAS